MLQIGVPARVAIFSLGEKSVLGAVELSVLSLPHSLTDDVR